MNKVSGVYQIINKITGERYVGSSRNIRQRFITHRSKGVWKNTPSSKLYKAFAQYGVENFGFFIVCLVEAPYLRQVEQEVIDFLHPEYNSMPACRKGQKYVYNKEQNRKKYLRNRTKALARATEYSNQLCNYNGEILRLPTLSYRLKKQGFSHPYLEAKKYLISEQHN